MATKRKDSISIIVAAHNEERTIENAVKTSIKIARKHFKEYEIIIINDGSNDRTMELAEKIAVKNKKIRVVHNEKPLCLGGVYKQGVKLAEMNYVMLMCGDNDTTMDSFDKIFNLKGKADIIIPYMVNNKDRPFFRRIISALFVLIINIISGLKIKYYNHYVLHKRTIINSIDIQTNSFAYQAEAMIKLIKKGHSYVQVGVIDGFDRNSKSSMFVPKNIFGVTSFLLRILLYANFHKN